MIFLNLNKLENFNTNYSFKVNSMEKQWRNTIAIKASEELSRIEHWVVLPKICADFFDDDLIEKVNNNEVILCIKYDKSQNDFKKIYLKVVYEENGYFYKYNIEVDVDELICKFNRSSPIRKLLKCNRTSH